jgi:hypothetical protein
VCPLEERRNQEEGVEYVAGQAALYVSDSTLRMSDGGVKRDRKVCFVSTHGMIEQFFGKGYVERWRADEPQRERIGRRKAGWLWRLRSRPHNHVAGLLLFFTTSVLSATSRAVVLLRLSHVASSFPVSRNPARSRSPRRKLPEMSVE